MALGDGIRRNIATVTKAERDRFRNAIIALNHQFYPGGRGDTPVGGVSYWFKQDEIHQSTHVHNCPAFLPWHRELLNRFEALLRLVDPALSLHYWDWTTDPSWMFTNDFMGNAHGDAGEPWQANAPPWRPDGLYNPGANPNRDASDNPFDPPLHITRGVGGFGILLPTPADDQHILDAPDFVEFHNRISLPHGNMHAYIGGPGGTLTDAHTSFRDPFVFLLHSNIDRLLVMWQHNPAHPERLDPAQVYRAWTNTKGSGDVSLLDPNWGILSPLEPWAGVNAQTPATGIIANVVSTRPWAPPENQTLYKDSRDPTVVNSPSYDTSPKHGIGPTPRVACATNQQSDLHVLAIDQNNGLWHTIRLADGTWPYPFGDVQAQTRLVGPNPGIGPTPRVACATNQQSDLHVLAIDQNNGLWHTIRLADGTWPYAFGDVQSQTRLVGPNPGIGPTPFVASAVNQQGDLHVLAIDENNGLWHTIRLADGTWPYAFGDVQAQTRLIGPNPGIGPTPFVACATNQQGDLHVLAIDQNNGLWHTIRMADGTWPYAFGDVQAQTSR